MDRDLRGLGTRHFVSLGLDGWDVVQTAPEDAHLWYALGSETEGPESGHPQTG
jgi:hypothetical protein